MVNCFGPLGGPCAFFGAIGFMAMFFGGIIGMGQVCMEPELYKGKNIPGMLWLALGGAGLTVIVIVLGFINQALLPPGC